MKESGCRQLLGSLEHDSTCTNHCARVQAHRLCMFIQTVCSCMKYTIPVCNEHTHTKKNKTSDSICLCTSVNTGTHIHTHHNLSGQTKHNTVFLKALSCHTTPQSATKQFHWKSNTRATHRVRDTHATQ